MLSGASSTTTPRSGGGGTRSLIRSPSAATTVAPLPHQVVAQQTADRLRTVTRSATRLTATSSAVARQPPTTEPATKQQPRGKRTAAVASINRTAAGAGGKVAKRSQPVTVKTAVPPKQQQQQQPKRVKRYLTRLYSGAAVTDAGAAGDCGRSVVESSDDEDIFA